MQRYRKTRSPVGSEFESEAMPSPTLQLGINVMLSFTKRPSHFLKRAARNGISNTRVSAPGSGAWQPAGKFFLRIWGRRNNQRP
jgi:hypothetical protein